jgi:zinc transporter 2
LFETIESAVLFFKPQWNLSRSIVFQLGSYLIYIFKMAKMDKETRLKLAIGLSLVFMCIEIAGGYLANSIAIFSDAAHLLTDIAGFAIALIATIAAKAPGTKTLTFGMARAEVFGAFGSILSLWIITAVLLYAAFFRGLAWFEGVAEPVDGFLMFVVACFGVLVNLCLGYVFHEDHGGAFHPAHSHDHGHACHGGGDHGHKEEHDHSAHSNQTVSKVSTDHGHDHGHSGECKSTKSDHGHDHGHAHTHNEKTPLLAGTAKKVEKAVPFAFTKAPKCDGGHDHGHSGHAETEVASTTLTGKHGGHDHSSHSHSAHDHDVEAALIGQNDHGHDHSHGGHEKYGSAELFEDHNHHGNHDSDVNLEAAYLHVLTDLIQSIGVAIAGAILWWRPNWQIIDPICTVLFSIVALNSTLPLIGRIGLILFEGAPANVRKLIN